MLSDEGLQKVVEFRSCEKRAREFRNFVGAEQFVHFTPHRLKIFAFESAPARHNRRYLARLNRGTMPQKASSPNLVIVYEFLDETRRVIRAFVKRNAVIDSDSCILPLRTVAGAREQRSQRPKVEFIAVLAHAIGVIQRDQFALSDRPADALDVLNAAAVDLQALDSTLLVSWTSVESRTRIGLRHLRVFAAHPGGMPPTTTLP